MEQTGLALKALVVLAALLLAQAAQSQPPQAPPPVRSPDVKLDRHVALRVHAPNAQSVRLNGGDIPGLPPGARLTRDDSGVWEITVGPLEPGAYRYTFVVDGVSVTDPRNPATSESVGSVWSLFVVPGSDVYDTRDVPHGAVAEVTYWSSALERWRRLHVYTPPGYEAGSGRYPVFYLLHGAGDSDDAWTTVGRAGFILDNLIAAGKARPMVVVMPAGHTRPFGPPSPDSRTTGARPPADEFEQDFVRDVMPLIARRYRVRTDRANTAIAGLSMGGAQTLNVVLPHQQRFGYVGVFSSGLFNAFPFRRPGEAAPPTASGRLPWEEQHLAELDNAEWKKGLRLMWFGTGKDDFLVQTTRGTVDLLRKHGFKVVYEETSGAHTWMVWRDYLARFAPQLFR